MAEKHELMARLQAARQNAGKIVDTESRKAYPDPEVNGQPIEAPVPVEPANPDELLTATPAAPVQEETPVNEGLTPTCTETPKEPGSRVEKVCYTTISVPKPYGHKAKLYATLLKVNIVDFTCGALDTYILQLQEAGKLPKVDL